jgi:arylsulfatase A-like enzyme
VSIDEIRRFLHATPQEAQEWRRLPARQASIEAQIGYFLAVAENDRRVALRLTREGRERFGQPPDLLVLFRLIDMVGHTSLRYSELVPDHLGASAEELRRYGRVVSEAYRTLDRSIGDLLDAFGPAANVMVVSDHGFELQSHPPENIPSYDHRNGAAGILLAAGPAFRPGRTDGLSILDLLPLMAELKGLPLAEDLDGRAGALTMGPLFVSQGAPRRVASYGKRPTGPAAGAARDSESAERLRALGYVQ